jgi:signal transduction histidine kinase
VPQRLIALVLVPTAFAAVLVGLRISGSLASADVFSRAEKFGRLSSAVVTLADEFTNERDLTAGFIAAGRPADQAGALQAEYGKVDADVRHVRSLASSIDSSYGATQTEAVQVVLTRLDGIQALRGFATQSKVSTDTVIDKYTESINELLSLLDGTTSGVGDDVLASAARALSAMARQMEATSRQRAFLLVGLTTGSLDSIELAAVLNAQSQEHSQLALYQTTATPLQLQFYNDTVTGPEIDQASLLEQQVITEASGLKAGRRLGLATPENVANWNSNMTTALDRVRTVEQRLGDDIAARAKSKHDSALNSALVSCGVAILLFLLVLLITFVMARSLVRPLRKLRSGALEVAGSRLPGLVERLRDPEAAVGGIEVAPIDIESTDEIGQVARAFDEVHREAVRLAANEAVLRGNINAMFVNLSRRSQSLIERQLQLIDELEQGERDDERLASLFRLDHLATRMRRNSENLLVLGGQDQVRRWTKPVPLIDVVRASLSEVEQYERVQLRVQSEVSIAGPVVNDLVHLIAELVENAISFSPEHTPITVSGHLVSGGSVMVQITDEGVGMTPDELAEANARLASPPIADVSVARRMGLFVVGRLATRHGIRVELRSTVSGGVTAFALLPERAVARGDQDALPVGSAATAATSQGDSWSAFNPSSQQRAEQRPAQRGGLAQPIWRTAQEAVPQAGAAPSAAAPPAAAPSARDLRREASLRSGLAGMDAPVNGGRADSPFTSGRAGTGPLTEPKPLPHRHNPDPYAADPVGETGPLPALPGSGLGSSGPTSSAPPAPPRPSVPAPPPVQQSPQRPQPQQERPVRSSGSSGPWGPVPSGETASGRRGERSPIFEAMTSEWFQARPAEERKDLPDPRAWKSAADEGWQMAETRTMQPTSSGRTSSGLPKRVPGQNRVPGAIPGAGGGAPQPPQAQPLPRRSQAPQSAPQTASPLPSPRDPMREVSRPPADVIRNRFSGLQRGVHRGRAETSASGAWAQRTEESGLDQSETGENT